MDDLFGLNRQTLFVNHDHTRLQVESPLLLVTFLFGFYALLVMVGLKRRTRDRPRAAPRS